MEDDDPASHFIRPRIFVGVGIFVLVGILAMIDALSLDYSLDNVTLGLMTGTGCVILGVEPLRRLIK